jgi:hypothetical protein
MVCTVLAAMAVRGLDISSRHSAREDAPANFEIQPGWIDNGDHDGMGPSRFAR